MVFVVAPPRVSQLLVLMAPRMPRVGVWGSVWLAIVRFGIPGRLPQVSVGVASRLTPVPVPLATTGHGARVS